jgi:hypothetical protein
MGAALLVIRFSHTLAAVSLLGFQIACLVSEFAVVPVLRSMAFPITIRASETMIGGWRLWNHSARSAWSAGEV